MINRELYFLDPTTIELLNNGVSKVSEIGHDERQIRTLRFELETFVCDGEYARGLERVLKAYLDGLGREEQKAVWVSGFFGSGKSHLVKVLRYLWEDYRFADGATARSLVKLPGEIADLLKELTNRSKPLGGLRAAAGTLGADGSRGRDAPGGAGLADTPRGAGDESARRAATVSSFSSMMIFCMRCQRAAGFLATQPATRRSTAALPEAGGSVLTSANVSPVCPSPSNALAAS